MRGDLQGSSPPCFPQALKLQSVLSRDYKRARETFNMMLGDAATPSHDEIASLMTSKLPVLSGMDRTWGIELAISTGIAGEGGLELLQSKVLDAFPDKSKPRTMAHTKQLLDMISEGGLYHSTSASNRGMVDAVCEVVDRMMAGMPPDIGKMDSEIMAQIALRLPLFCTHTAPAQKGALPTQLVGKAAAEAKFDILADKKKKHELKFDDMDELQIFSWLLGEAKRSEMDRWTKDLLDTVTTVSKKRKGPQSKDDKKKKANEAKGAASTHEADEVMALFAS